MTASLIRPTLDHVRRALALQMFDAARAWARMAPRPRTLRRPQNWEGTARMAAVLLLLYPCDGDLCFVLTRRTETLNHHSGQISLPGGALDPDDADTGQAALRELCEELQVCRDGVLLLGPLTPIYVIVSDFEIHPHVGYIEQHPQFVPNPAEVAEVIEMPLTALLDDSIKQEEHWIIHGFELEVPFYRFGEHIIWGATAIMLSEFEQRLKAVLAG